MCPFIRAFIIILILLSGHANADLLLSESFEDSSFSSRGWYDGTATSIASGGYSGNCLEMAWSQYGSYPSGINSIRYLFTASDQIFVRIYFKLGSTWQGQQVSYGGPHILYILSDQDTDYGSLASSELDTYLEFFSDVGSPYATYPRFTIQDSELINTGYGTPPIDLTSTTEDRSSAGCNGNLGSAGDEVSCYQDGQWYNGRVWTSDSSVTKNTWIRFDTWIVMNSISGGIAQADGVMKQWIDGMEYQSYTNMVFRTNIQSTKKWEQFVIAPFMGSSPIAQTLWVDELEVHDENLNEAATPTSTSGGNVSIH